MLDKRAHVIFNHNLPSILHNLPSIIPCQDSIYYDIINSIAFAENAIKIAFRGKVVFAASCKHLFAAATVPYLTIQIYA